MCGILAILGRENTAQPSEHATALVRARGPDSFHSVSIAFAPGHILTCYSSVLALRGDSVQQQPLVDPSTRSLLCWNGEAWKFQSKRVTENDSIQVFHALLAAASSGTDSRKAISDVLTAIAGPFAFVFYDAISSALFYGRDQLGRRSLTLQRSANAEIILCSVASLPDELATEVETTCVHTVTLQNGQLVSEALKWPSVPQSVNAIRPTTELQSQSSPSTVDSLLARLSDALKLRVTNVPTHSQLHTSAETARIAVLFSGGLDCTLLARMAHDLIPSEEAIDLLNIAFENPRSLQAQPVASTSPYETCPDRRTGRASFAELCSVCPQRKWRFVAIDMPYTSTLAHKEQIIELMRPHNTEMDLSIGMALYFAARGEGTAYVGGTAEAADQAYTTTARVLLSGLGADELFGGYSRHAAAFARSAYAGLAAELDLDYQRIGQRNLGRDDRVISHWGKETRYPFLDEDFVRFSLQLPVWEKCGFRQDKAIPKHYEETVQVDDPAKLEPAKLLLRLAAWRLGMTKVAAERKRAIQFGARTAKMEVGAGRKRGTDPLR